MQSLFILFPLCAVLILNLPYKKELKKYAVYLALFITLLQMLLTLTTGVIFWNALVSRIQSGFLNDLKLDFLSLTMLFTIGLIASVSLFVCEFSTDKGNFNFVNLILIAVMGMNGVVMVRDIFSLYVFLEITAVASFILIAVNNEKDAFEGAFKYLVMSALATIFMLTAIALLFMTSHSLGFEEIKTFLQNQNGNYSIQISIAFILFITGLCIKAGIMPFHGGFPTLIHRRRMLCRFFSEALLPRSPGYIH